MYADIKHSTTGNSFKFNQIYQSTKADPNLGSLAISRLATNKNTDLQDIISLHKKRHRTPHDFRSKHSNTINRKVKTQNRNASIKLDLMRNERQRKTPELSD